MNTISTPKTKRITRTFQPWNENEQRLDMASRIGINVSELINEILKDRLDAALTAKSRRIQTELKVVTKMVRGAGFEPATPTVSR